MSLLEPAFRSLLPMLDTDPMLRIAYGRDGRPVAASAFGLIDAPSSRIWSVLSDVERYSERVPLIDRVKVRGDAIEIALRFRVSFFSVGFSFECERSAVEGRSFALRYRSGEPKDLEIDYLVEPTPGRDDQTALGIRIGFDPLSVGWLARYFLKHHPEIQFGVHSGCALSLFDSMKRAA